MNIKKELTANKTLLLIMPGVEYNKIIIDVIKQISEKNVCYVTLNKTHNSLRELFEKNKIDTSSIVFIDAISKVIKDVPSQTKGCYFCSYPGALTEISTTISKFLRHDFDYLIFDSLTNLSIYQQKDPVAQFLSALTNKIRDSSTKAVFYALNVKSHDELIKETEMFVDKVIEMKKQKANNNRKR
jgi:KaiC/GvpD/RAD55 family RecA-like ATPase